MSRKKKLLVVTDLDATLLDHEYAWAKARPALAQLRALGSPLVLNSSKTLREMADLASDLGLDSPIVAENGGVLAWPSPSSGAGLSYLRDYSVELTGLSRERILQVAHGLRARSDFRFSGFADWSDAGVSERTGLAPVEAAASRERLATEPILWEDTEDRRLDFVCGLGTLGIRMLRGGRFWHLMGSVDKASSLSNLRAYYRKKEPTTEWVLVALGDSQNDVAMLEAADRAVVIPHASGPRINPQGRHVSFAAQPASAGWNASILSLLNEYRN